jgi:hypothetical protein
MSLDNPLWGALRIHGELLKLGFQVAQSTVAKYTVRGHGRPPGPELVDISAQSHARDRGDGLVHRADACLRPALWLHHRSPGSPRARRGRRDEKPHSRLDCTPDRGSVPLVSAGVPDPRPRPRLWLNRTVAPPCNRHAGQTYCEVQERQVRAHTARLKHCLGRWHRCCSLHTLQRSKANAFLVEDSFRLPQSGARQIRFSHCNGSSGFPYNRSGK